MNQEFVYKEDIDLLDLMFSVLRKWKVMLVFALLFALLLGGYKGFSEYRKGTSEVVVKEAEKKYNDELLSYNNKVEKLKKEITNITKEIEQQEEYLEKSIWLKVSPYDICEARADIYVDTGYSIMPGMSYQNVDYTETILQVYQSLLKSNEVKETISHKANTEPRYLDELLSVSKTGRILTINVKHITKDQAQDILNDMIVWLNDLKPHVEATIGEHTISIVNSGASSVVNLDHADTQTKQKQKLEDYEKDLETKQKSLDELKAPDKTEFNMKTVAKTVAIFSIIGGVLGIFTVIFSVCVITLLSDKVYSSKELKRRCGIKVVGTLPTKAYKCLIDKWLDKLEGRVFESNESVRNNIIAGNTRNSLGEINKLLVMGNADRTYIDMITNVLRTELQDVIVISGGNMLKDVDTIKKLPECEGVLLVEECGTSKYADIKLEIENTRDLGKYLVGCVVIG